MNEQLHGLEKALALTNAYAVSGDVAEKQEAHRAAHHLDYNKPAEDAGFLAGIAAETAVCCACIDQAISGNMAPLYVYGGLKAITQGAALFKKGLENWFSSVIDSYFNSEEEPVLEEGE